MMGNDQTARKVLNLVERWRPTKAYGHESKFQNELQDFLDAQLNDSGGGGLGMMGGGSNYVVSREHGKSKGDVVVDDAIGIEMKRDLSNSQTKKLRGQIEVYQEEYDYVIVCACGITDQDGWRELQNKYEHDQMNMGMMQQNSAPVRFVHKKKSNYGESPDSGGSGLFGGLL